MKRYSVALVRERLAEALDAADRGVPVVIERRGVRYRISVERPKGNVTAAKRTPIFESVDPGVAAGEWTWDWTPRRVTFKSRRPR